MQREITHRAQITPGAGWRLLACGLLLSGCIKDFPISLLHQDGGVDGGDGAPPYCGDGVLNTGEVCDDGNNTNCDGCRGDCSAWETGCGDGFLCGAEECDGDNLGGLDCTDYGYTDATGLACNPVSCTADASSCAAVCGNGDVEPGEACDDGINDGSYDGCGVGCLALGPYCGDGVTDPTDEVCDGTDLGGETCASQTGGTEPEGTLSCAGDCQSIDSSGCFGCANHGECPVGQQCTQYACVDVGNTCDASPTVITQSGTFSHTTENLTDDTGGDGCGALAIDAAGPDRVYAVPLLAGEYLVAWVSPLDGWDAALYLGTTCPLNIPADCPVGWHRANAVDARERLDFVAPSDGTYYLVVDGEGAGDWGTYDLAVTVGPSVATADASGQVIFSEAMPWTSGTAAGRNCEWFEVTNTTSTAINLEGLEFFYQTNASFIVDYPLVLRVGEFLVFARRADPGGNCGLDWISWVASVDLTNGANTLSIEEPISSLVIDQVSYDGGWPYVQDDSMYLCTNHLDTDENNDINNWAQASTAYGNGMHGTPAAANEGPCN